MKSSSVMISPAVIPSWMVCSLATNTIKDGCVSSLIQVRHGHLHLSITFSVCIKKKKEKKTLGTYLVPTHPGLLDIGATDLLLCSMKQLKKKKKRGSILYLVHTHTTHDSQYLLQAHPSWAISLVESDMGRHMHIWIHCFQCSSQEKEKMDTCTWYPVLHLLQPRVEGVCAACQLCISEKKKWRKREPKYLPSHSLLKEAMLLVNWVRHMCCISVYTVFSGATRKKKEKKQGVLPSYLPSTHTTLGWAILLTKSNIGGHMCIYLSIGFSGM